MSNKKQDIPISLAKEVSEKSGFPCIIIYGYDKNNNLQHVTTYGETKNNCLDACECGNWLKRQLGWAKELCNAKPTKTTLESKK